MCDLVGPCLATGLTPGDAAVLTSLGWNLGRLGTMADAGEEALRAVWEKCLEADENFHDDFEDFMNLVKLADPTADALRKTEAKRGAAAWFQAHMEEEQAKRQRMREDMVKSAGTEAVQRQSTAPRVRWPTRLDRGLAAAGEVSGMREKIEKAERDRWLKALHAQMVAAELPVSKRERSRGSAPLSRIGKGRRPATLRKHVKTWDRISRWLMVVYHRRWLSRPEEFAEFLEAAVAEPCSRTFPVSCYKTLMLFEYAGEVEEGKFMHRAPCI